MALGKNEYRLETALFGSRQGQLRDVLEFGVHYLDMDFNELEYALLEMNKNDHNAAEFNRFGHFVNTFWEKT
jgi:hypothetical protein